MANVVSITLNAIDKTKAGFTGPIKNLSDLEKRIDQIKPAVMTLAATAAAAFGVMMNHAIDAADEMGKLAQKAGTTTEVFSSLAYVGNQAGIGSDKLAKAFKELSKNVDEAKNPMSASAQMLSQLGVTLKDASGNALSTDHILLQLADRFADTADDGNKVAAATKLFGDKLGQDLIPFLNQGASGIKQLQEEAKELGQVFSDDAAKNASAFNDNLTKLKAALQGIVNIVAAEMLPHLVALTDAMVDWIKETGVVRGAANTLIDVFRIFDYWIKAIITAFGALSDVFVGLGSGLAHLASSFVDFSGLVGSSLGNMAAVIEEVIQGNFQNAQTIGRQSLASMKQDVINFLQGIPLIAQSVGQGISDAFETLKKGPVAPDLNAFGNGSHGDGTVDNPITITGKGSMPTITTTGTAGILPSGYTMEAYKLDQDMMIKTQEMLFAAAGNRISLSEQQAQQLELEKLREEERYQARLMQISGLQLEETENYALIEKAAQEHAARMGQIHSNLAKTVRQHYGTMLDASASIFSSMAQLAQAQGKKGFAAYQAFSYAQAVVSVAAGVARAFADFPWPVSAFVAAAVGAAGAAQIATIASTKPPQAHAGATMIPEEATYLLKGGERVLAPEQNQDLTAFLSGNSGAPTQVAIYLDGEMLGKGVGQLSRDGRLEISARAIV